jgi:LPS-assembly protein
MRSGNPPATPSQFFSSLIGLFLLLFYYPAQAQEISEIELVPKLEIPVEIQADRLEYQKEKDRYEAEGSVKILQGDLQLNANRIILENKTGDAHISGDFFFLDGENSLEGEEGELNIKTRQGRFYNSRLVLQPGGYRIQGEILEKLSEDRYALERGWFTTCECEEEEGTPDWRFRVQNMRVQLEGYLVAKDVTFYVKKVPVFYVPWFVYPAKRERQTGLLIPHFGYSSTEGFKYSQALFWALNPHMDATLTLDTRSDRGVGGGLEYRYKLSRTSQGSLNTFLFHDTDINEDRLDMSYHHLQEFTPHFKGRVDGKYVNDDSYFRDLSEFTEERSQRSLESNVSLIYGKENHFAFLLGRYTQDLTSGSDQTLQTLPKVGYSLIPFRLGSLPLFASVETSGDQFWREEGIKARRLDLAPKIFLHFEPLRGLVMVPAIGFRETLYSREQASRENTHREIYWTSLRADTKLARTFMMKEGSTLNSIRHQIEPSVLYEYVEEDEKSPPPFFDELDVVDPQHRVTYSILQRFLAFYQTDDQTPKVKRLEFLSLKFTQSYNIKIPPVPVLNGAPVQRPFSDLRGEMWVATPWPVGLEVDSFLDLEKGRWSSVNSDLNFTLMSWWNASFGHRFTQTTVLPQRGISVPEVHFFTLSTTLKLPLGFTFANRAYYDLNRHAKTEMVYGVQYESQCWAVAFAFQDLPEKDQFSFLISLKGAGAIETGLLHRLFFSP